MLLEISLKIDTNVDLRPGFVIKFVHASSLLPSRRAKEKKVLTAAARSKSTSTRVQDWAKLKVTWETIQWTSFAEIVSKNEKREKIRSSFCLKKLDCFFMKLFEFGWPFGFFCWFHLRALKLCGLILYFDCEGRGSYPCKAKAE